MSTFLYILLGILIFGVLIIVHEGGHFMAARLCGVKVLEFSVGMGPLIVQKESRRGTQISLRALPIGGYCAMQGEDDVEGESDDPASFANAALWKKLIILAAGAAMNFLMGVVLVMLIYTQLDAFSAPVITGFMDGCPYESETMLQEGDLLWRINGERIYFTSDVSTYMARGSGDTMDIVVVRDGKKVHLEPFEMILHDYIDEETGETVQRYGLYFGEIETGFGARMKYAWYSCCDFVRLVRIGLTDLVTGQVGVNQLSGVVGIVDTIADVGNESANTYEALLNIGYLAALIAVNLAMMNMLPIPGLDGGHIFLLLISTVLSLIVGHKIDTRYERWINGVCLVLLFGLMFFVMYNDIVRIITG